MRLCTLPITCVVLSCLAGCSKGPSPEQQQADVALAKARTYISRGENREARTQLFAALRLDENIGRGSKMAEEERTLGDLYAVAASFDSALIYYTLASEQYRNLADRRTVQSITLDIASLDRLMGENRKAAALYEEALRLAKVFGDSEGVRDIEWAMLPACRALDDSEDESAVLADLSRAFSSGGTRLAARVLFETGLGLFHHSRYDSSAQVFLRAFTIALQTKDSLLACSSLQRLAMSYDAAGRAREALQSYADGLRLVDRLKTAQQLRMELLCRVGNMYLRDRQYTEATRFYRAAMTSALAVRNRIAEGYLTVQLGHCVVETSRDAAVKNYRSAVDLFASLPYPPGLSYATLSLALASQRAGQNMESLQQFKSAVEQSEQFLSTREPENLYAECERAFLGDSPTPAYDECLALLFQLGRTDEAYWYLERRSNRMLHDALKSLTPRTADEETNAALDGYVRARARRIGAERQLERLLISASHQKEILAEVRSSLALAASRVADAGNRLSKANPAFDPLVRTRTFNIADVQKMLPPATALVQYAPTRRSLYAMVITGTRASVQVAAMERQRVVSLGTEFLRLLGTRAMYADSAQRNLSPMDQRLQEISGLLSEAFIRPVEGDLAGCTSLLVLLPPELPSLPLHALRTGAFRTGPYLAERYLVSYLPDAITLYFRGASPSAVHDVVGMGCPGETSWDVEYELRDIRAFFKEARLSFGQQATFTALQKEHGDVLHLAVEYNYHAAAPANSFLFLSDAQSGSGLKPVLLEDLFSLPAYATVVISNLANESIAPAEPYPFLADGSGSVIMNCYTPSRKTKKYFGEIFYTTLLAGSTCTSAYHAVQLAMMKNPEYAAPYVWAPFFLWGKQGG